MMLLNTFNPKLAILKEAFLVLHYFHPFCLQVYSVDSANIILCAMAMPLAAYSLSTQGTQSVIVSSETVKNRNTAKLTFPTLNFGVVMSL